MSTKQFRRKRSRKVIPTVPEKWKEEFDKLALVTITIYLKTEDFTTLQVVFVLCLETKVNPNHITKSTHHVSTLPRIFS